jgi:hypothetical protein
MLISFLDQGVSDDTDERNLSFYRRVESGYFGVKQVQEGRLRYSSLFRLFGVQSRPSPTLVQVTYSASILPSAFCAVMTAGRASPCFRQSLLYRSHAA